MLKAALIWLLVLIGLSARAQTDGEQSVSGRVIDTTAASLSHATIQLIAAADTLTTVSDDNGNFLIRNVKTRTFRINVTMKGYLPFSKSVTTDGVETFVKLPTITLRINYEDLDPVIISRSRPVIISGDTLNYNTSAFPVREGSEVEDILRRLPGIEVDLDGNIIVQGKKVARVTVNGKDFYGGDVLLAIRNLPADIVSKIQIIDDYGDKARLTGIKVDESVKLLNIVLKADKNHGLFGHVSAGVGNEGKYAADGFGNYFLGDRQLSAKTDARDDNPAGRNPNEQLAVSYSDEYGPRLRSALNAGANFDDAHTNSTVNQRNFYPGQQLTQEQQTTSDSHGHNYHLGETFTWNPNGLSTLRMTPTFNVHSDHGESVTNFTSNEQDSTLSKTVNGFSSSHSLSKGWNTGNDLYFEKTMPGSKHRFNIDAAISYSDNQSPSDNLSISSIMANDTASQSQSHYLINNTSGNLMFNLRTNYYYPIGAGKFMEFGYNIQSTRPKNDVVTRSLDSATGALIVIDSLSLKDLYSTIIQQLHGGYEASYGKLSLEGAVDCERGRLQSNGDRKDAKYSYPYNAWLPRVRLIWRLSQKNTFSFQYTGSITVPSIQQVIPVTNVSNVQNPVTGNPNLRPCYPQTAYFSYENSHLQSTQFSGFGVSVGFTIVSGPIITATTHPLDGSEVIQTVTFINAGKSISYSAGYHFTLPSFYNKIVHVTGSGGFGYNQSPVSTDGVLYNSNSLSWNQAIHVQLSVSKKNDVELEGTFSLTHSAFPSVSRLPSVVQTAGWQVGGRHFFFEDWILDYRLIQLYVSSGNGLRPSQPTLIASLQRDFLRHNRASVSITGYNLLNAATASAQIVTPTSITQTQTAFVGRFILVKFTLKLQRFR